MAAQPSRDPSQPRYGWPDVARADAEGSSDVMVHTHVLAFYRIDHCCVRPFEGNVGTVPSGFCLHRIRQVLVRRADS
jgi:hypothetical protein